jgi:hypothetical protein
VLDLNKMAKAELSLKELREAQSAMTELQTAQTNAFEILEGYQAEGISGTDQRVKNIKHVIADNRRGKDGLRALNTTLKNEPYNQ